MKTDITILKPLVLASALLDSPLIRQIDPTKIDDILVQALDLINAFEKKATDILPLHTDTDIVWVVSGPGAYSLNIPPYEDKPDRYSHLRWSRGMDRARINAGVKLVQDTAASLLYHATTWEINHFKEAIKAGLISLPKEKIILYDSFRDPVTQKIIPIINTSDQVDGLSRIRVLKPRRLVLVSHPAHLVRLLYMMGRRPKPLFSKTILQVYPVPTPPEGQKEYTIMEVRGILAYIYKYKKASSTPIPFEI